MSLLLGGVLLVTFSAGMMLSARLAAAHSFILFVSMILLVMSLFVKKRPAHVAGSAGLVFFAGMYFTQFPFKTGGLVFGILFILAGLVQRLLKDHKRLFSFSR